MLAVSTEANSTHTKSTDPKLFTSQKLFEKIKAMLQSYSQKYQFKTVLDVPAGGGTLAKFLKEELALQVSASDIDAKKYEYLSVKLDQADLGEKLPYASESFDLVVCLEGLKHVFNVSRAVGELARVVKKNGFVFITIPNDLCMQTKLKYFFDSQVDIDWGDIDLTDENYLQHLYLGSLVQLPLLYHFMRVNGLKLIECQTSNLRFWSVLLAIVFYPFIWLRTRRYYKPGHPLLKELTSLVWLAGRRNILVCQKR